MKFKCFIFALLLSAISNARALSELDNLSAEDQKILELLKPGWEANWNDYVFESPKLDLCEGDVEDIDFLLYTRENPVEPIIMEPNNPDSLKNSTFKGDLMTYIQFHGWGSSGYTQWIQDSTEQLLDKRDCNVIAVDYQTLVPSLCYIKSVLNVYKVANATAHLLDWLKKEYSIEYKKIHIIGHSLGAQAAGMTGQLLESGKVSRVTGLDPAGPLYYLRNDSFTISQTSADFVDIIHTNGCFMLEGCEGLYRAVGHADFYPNGGQHQKGCLNENATHTIGDFFTGCSHHRSVEYWVESIEVSGTEKDTFWGFKCSTYNHFRSGECNSCPYGCDKMGFEAKSSSWGIYYLDTNSQDPYALGSASTNSVTGLVLLATLAATIRTFFDS